MAKKRTNGSGMISVAFVFIIFGLAILIGGRNDIKSAFMKPYDIYDVNYDEIKVGDAVKTEIYAALDTYGTLETTRKNSKTGNVTGRTYSYFYIIPVYDDYDTYYMSIKVEHDDKDLFEDICNSTWDVIQYGDAGYYTDVPYEFEGNVQKLDDEAYKYMKEWFEEAGFDDDEIDEYVLPICLEVCVLSNIRILTIAGIAAVVIGILLFVLYFVLASKRKKKAAETVASSSYAEAAQAVQSQTASTDYVEIAGAKFTQEELDLINALIASGSITDAIREVRDRTGLGINEAKDIVDNWGNYYNK